MPLRDPQLLPILASLQPELHPGVYVYCSTPNSAGIVQLQPLATFKEAEGMTLIVEESVAQSANLEVLFRSAWITLRVHSDLTAVGLTAAFSTALGKAGISCNVVAAAFHDHLFVPLEQAAHAMEILGDLQAAAQATQGQEFGPAL